MTGQKTQSQKETGKLAYVIIPSCFFAGIGLGWVLSRFVTGKRAVTQKKIATETPPRALYDRVREKILAIDNELKAATDAEHRKVLVSEAYKLMDLGLRARLQELPKVSASKTSFPIG
jgi:hypothetical protein